MSNVITKSYSFERYALNARTTRTMLDHIWVRIKETGIPCLFDYSYDNGFTLYIIMRNEKEYQWLLPTLLDLINQCKNFQPCRKSL